MNLDALEEQVTALRRITVVTKSRDIYSYSIIKLLKWLYKNKSHLMTQFFFEKVRLDTNGEPTDDSLCEMLSHQPNNPPIQFDMITARDFLTWLV
jgi:hypothetical protein